MHLENHNFVMSLFFRISLKNAWFVRSFNSSNQFISVFSVKILSQKMSEEMFENGTEKWTGITDTPITNIIIFLLIIKINAL